MKMNRCLNTVMAIGVTTILSTTKPMFLDELLALDPNRTQAAREACGEDEACLFDYLAVSPEMGNQTMTTGNQLDNDLLNLGEMG